MTETACTRKAASLAAADALEIDRWAETPVTFTNSRWLKPIDRFREDLYLYSPKGAQYTADGLRARWGRWLADPPEGREIGRRWKEWIAAQVKKYDWDIEPDDADHPTIHGLRGKGILARAEQDYGSTRSPTISGCAARMSSIRCGFATR